MLRGTYLFILARDVFSWQAAKVCIAEVEELVEPGQLDPDEIHLPGIYVQRIIKGESRVPI